MNENVAWEVPNSRLVVNVILRPKTYSRPAFYQAGVMLRSSVSNDASYMLFTGDGHETRAGALENMMERVNMMVHAWKDVLDCIKEDAAVAKEFDWWNWPRRFDGDDLVVNCFRGLIECDRAIRKGAVVCNRYASLVKNDGFGGYASCLVDDSGRILYRDVVKSDMVSCHASLERHLMSVGVLLDRLENGAWMAFVSNDAEDFRVKCGENGGLVLEKIGG